MATVTKPLALDESINTTEQTPRNVADVLAQGLDAIEQAIAGGSGSGGHVIEDTNGTALTQRADLQFVGVYTEDDSANDRTKVNVVRTMTAAEMQALSPAERVGFIRTTDEPDNPYQHTDASDVSYGSTTVEDALDGLVNLSVLNGCGFSVVNGTPLSNGFLALGLNYTNVPIAASVRNPYNTKIFISISRFVYDGGWYGFVEKYNSTSKVWEPYTSQTAMSVLVFYKDLN